ncbi:MAG TPA: TlpA disulfide reductase family protein [Bacteroidales bacterium]|nr:TlpA disulfide reductase family protein [Bacteroidales bacterium]
MKHLRILLLLALIPVFSVAQQSVFSYQHLPSVKMKTVKGLPFTSDSITNHGKPIIISFWATWCKPCIRELTTISDVYSEWVEETGVKLYAVSIDDARSSSLVAPLANGKGWEYTVLLDPNGDFKRAMNVGPIPHTFLIDGSGKVVFQHTSFAEGDELNLIEMVRKLNRGEKIE